MKNETGIFKAESKPKAILASVFIKGSDREAADASLKELALLLDTAGGEFFAFFTQEKDSVDVATAIGSGKVRELDEVCKNNDVHLVVFDMELTPSQIKNLEEQLDGVRVIDRSMLILDIFALHATSGEGKLQVELAQLKYTLPRLTGKGTEMSRLGGGIGTRGPGETKLESDKRHLKRRIALLEEQARELEKNRMTMRAQREKSGLFKIAIAGYKNASKSTVLNFFTVAVILSEIIRFATLYPTTRKFKLPSGREILLTDTVGFIRNLPHHLIKAFKSTLDEVRFADAIMLVADTSDTECANQITVALNIIDELGTSDKPLISVYNKHDSIHPGFIPPIRRNIHENDASVYVSAKTGEGMDRLAEILELVSGNGKTTEIFRIPHDKGNAISWLYKNSDVISCEYEADETVVTALVDQRTKGTVEKMIKGENR